MNHQYAILHGKNKVNNRIRNGVVLDALLAKHDDLKQVLMKSGSV
jgi:hypothetical protein